MPTYSGETVRIQSSGKGLNKQPLTETEVSSATASIWSPEGDLLVDSQNMSYDSDTQIWYYDWDTGTATPQPPGRYRAKVTLSGVDFEAWEYIRFRLQANPV